MSTEVAIPETATEIEESEAPWICPYCCDEGGEPMSIPSREFQGCYGHGGMVEWEEQCCSKCFRGLLS